MGIAQSNGLAPVSSPNRPDRLVFVRNCEIRKIRRNFRRFIVVCMNISYQRYVFTIFKIYEDFQQLELTLRKFHMPYMVNIPHTLPSPSSGCCGSTQDNVLQSYAACLMQMIFDVPELFESNIVRVSLFSLPISNR
jgi:hypothetical protein